LHRAQPGEKTPIGHRRSERPFDAAAFLYVDSPRRETHRRANQDAGGLGRGARRENRAVNMNPAPFPVPAGLRPPVTFATARLVARPPRADDAEKVFTAYASDPEVTRYLSWRAYTRVPPLTAFLAESAARWEK